MPKRKKDEPKIEKVYPLSRLMQEFNVDRCTAMRPG